MADFGPSQLQLLEPGYLPVCKIHEWQKDVRRAGRCQALEECGQLCNRLAEHQPPYHLCEKHQRGSDSLPCYLMRIPTELRLMVFRYLFPDVVSPYHCRFNVAVLKLNRQIYQEASSVLYDERWFQVAVDESSISLQGKVWNREPSRRSKSSDYTVSGMLCQEAVSRIRKLEVSLPIGAGPRLAKAVGHDISTEDYGLYAMRDAVRKMVHALSGLQYDNEPNTSLAVPRALTTLVVKPRLSLRHNWSPDEAAVAIFFVLEPLQILNGLQRAKVDYPRIERIYPTPSSTFITRLKHCKLYSKLRKQCLNALTEPKTDSLTIRQGVPTEQMQNGYRKLEAFARLTRLQASAHPWMSGIFQNLDRPLHLARVAYDNNDLKMISSIQEAIKLRWVNAHCERQKSLQAMADSINTMFEDDAAIEVENDNDDGHPTPRDLFPDAFQFNETEPLKQTFAASQAHMWAELKMEDDAPKGSEDGVTVKNHGMWRTIRKGGKKWYRLTTPAVIREIQAEKAAKSQT